jgi:hypothetical protein
VRLRKGEVQMRYLKRSSNSASSESVSDDENVCYRGHSVERERDGRVNIYHSCSSLSSFVTFSFVTCNKGKKEGLPNDLQVINCPSV